MRISIAVAVVALAVSCGRLRQPDKPKRGLELRANATYFSGTNGFKVFVLPDAAAQVVRVEVRFDVGAAHDPPGKAGLAHLVEHMMFQSMLPASEGHVPVMAALGEYAQSWNASTKLDSTHYMSQALPKNVGELFAIEALRLESGCKTWNEANFIREREVVRNEIRRHHASPSGAVGLLLHEAIYPEGHPYRRVVGGTDESIATITLADACAFVERYYTPHHASFYVIGDVTEDQVRRLAGQWLTRFPATTPQPVATVPPVAPGQRRTVRHALDIDQALVLVAFPLPPRGTRDHRLATLTAGVLRFQLAEWAAEYDWGDGVGVGVAGGARAPALLVSMRLRDEKHVDKALDATWRALKWAKRAAARKGDTKRSMSWVRQREWAKEDLIAAYEPLSGRGAMYADYNQFDDDELFLIGRLEELDKVGPQTARRAVESVLKKDHATVVVVYPRSGETKYRAAEYEYSASGHGDDHWQVPVDLADADRPVALRASTQLLAATRYTLDNGLTVLMWPHGTLPLVHGALVVRAGSADEPLAKAGLARAAGGRVGFDVTTFYGRDLATEAHELVERLSRPLRYQFTRDRDDWRERVGQLLRMRTAEEQADYRTRFRRALYGAQHPYAGGIYTKTSIANIDGDSVASYQRTFRGAARSTLILSGLFDPSLMKQWVEYRYDQVGAKSKYRNNVPDADTVESATFVPGYTEYDRPTVSNRIGWVAGRGIDRDYAARLVLASALSAKLRSIRERHAITYGLYATYTPRLGPGEWVVGGQVDAARAGEAADLIIEVVDQMRGDPASYRGEFVIARRDLVEQLLTQSSSATEVADRLEIIARFDLSLDFYDELLVAVAELTPADVHRVLTADLAPDRMVWGAFGHRSAVDDIGRRVATGANAVRAD